MAVAQEIMCKIFNKSMVESMSAIVISMAIISVVPVPKVVVIVRVGVMVNSVVGVVSMMRSIVDRSSVVGWQWSSGSSGSQYGNNERSHG